MSRRAALRVLLLSALVVVSVVHQGCIVIQGDEIAPTDQPTPSSPDDSARQTPPPTATEADVAMRVTAGQSVVLSAPGAPEDSGAQSFTWRQVAGSAVQLSDTTAANPTFAAPGIAESLRFVVTITAPDGKRTEEVVVVEIVTNNRAPRADAGASVSVRAGDTVVLDASGSSDPDDDPLSFEWQQRGGAPVTLESLGGGRQRFVAPNVDDTLEFEVLVSDGRSGSDRARVRVTIDPKRPPTARIAVVDTVAGGAAVVLDGTASSDPDGDALTYSWRQIDGRGVQVLDSDQPVARFDAPQRSTTIEIELRVTDPDGMFDDATIEVGVRVAPTLFVADPDVQQVLSFDDPSTLNGNIAPTSAMKGLVDGAFVPVGIVVAGNDLLVANQRALGSLSIYDDRAMVSGNLTPDAMIAGTNTALRNPLAIAYDTRDGAAYVLGAQSDEILVFDNVYGRTGDVAPTRTFRAQTLTAPIALTVDHHRLFVADASGAVFVFDDAPALVGDVQPTHIFTIDAPLRDLVRDVEVRDETLYLLDSGGQLLAFPIAEITSGALAPARTIAIAGAEAQFLTAIEIDREGFAYVLDLLNARVLTMDNIRSAAGTVTPTRQLAGNATGMIGPVSLYLWER